jgi:hypothetical protein
MARGVSLTDMAHDAGVAVLAYPVRNTHFRLLKLGHYFELPIDERHKLELCDIGGVSVIGVKYEHLG